MRVTLQKREAFPIHIPPPQTFLPIFNKSTLIIDLTILLTTLGPAALFILRQVGSPGRITIGVHRLL